MRNLFKSTVPLAEGKEHPKPLVEMMSNTREAVEAYAQATKVSLGDAALILCFNELRCIHWHLDRDLAEKENNHEGG